ncbi:fatty acid desaturase [Streptacidiphilus sp. MAP12-20]|uniref:fatty acid desaturase family protein n=1 Tax=Streptacidiphilus sp. MAP12-20 TaxID=3156299 RepID=UPI0035123324
MTPRPPEQAPPQAPTTRGRPADAPSLADLGADLLLTSPARRALALGRPCAAVAGFAAAAWAGWWWATPLLMFGAFVSVVTATHDVVHRALGLSRRGSDLALFALGLVLLESGHAYRASHSQHHRIFPHPDDPEGRPADLGFLRAVCYGPVFLPRLWWWAFRRAPGGPARRWLLAEAAAPFAVLGAGVWLRPYTPGVLIYAVLAIVGSWVYPLLTVHLPHHGYGDSPLTQTRTLRGRLLPALFLELTYHLEHHLYPQVPSHHLPELSRRLDGYLRSHGVRPVRVV